MNLAFPSEAGSTALKHLQRGEGIGYSGYKHQKGKKVIAITDNNGYVLAPVPVAPVNETDMVLLPEGLKALKQVAKTVGVDLRGAYLNLDGGFDSTRLYRCHALVWYAPTRHA